MIRADADADSTLTAETETEPMNARPPLEAEPVDHEPYRDPNRPEESRLQTVGGVILQLVVSAVILVVGVAVAMFLVSIKTQPAEVPTSRSAPVVNVTLADPRNQTNLIVDFGTIRPARRFSVVPQVGGRIVEVNPEFTAGGMLGGGATVMKIEAIDYELAEAQADANRQRMAASLRRMDAMRRSTAAEVARAQTALDTMQAEADVARREYEQLNPGQDVPPLAAKEPQLAERRAALEAAQAMVEDVDAQEDELKAQLLQAENALERAKLDVARTAVTLPDGDDVSYRVLAEQVEVGQSVTPSVGVGEVYDATNLEVPVGLDADLLDALTIGGDDASAATVFAGSEQYEGRVVRTEGEIDPRTRQVQVIVAIEVPASATNAVASGRFVRVEIQGAELANVVTLPRSAVHRDVDDREAEMYVLLADPTGKTDSSGHSLAKVRRQPVEVVRQQGEQSLVRGIATGDRVVTTRMEVAAENMEVQLSERIAAGEGDASRPEIDESEPANE